MDYPATYWIDRMLAYAVSRGLVEQEDESYTRNLLMDAMRLNAPEPYPETAEPPMETLSPMTDALSGIAAARGLIEDTADARDRFGVRLAGLITPSPQTVREHFAALYQTQGEREASAWFYRLCRDNDYIRVARIARNVQFTEPSPAGPLEITINLSKPEKDPRDIAAALSASQVDYPPCMLCVENPGYAGRPGFPARQNHRIIPLELKRERYYLQFSPYLYYNQHLIVLSEEHRPMKIDRAAMGKLFDFVELFPHYFLGANADLPIVGGSILSHDHFQGGAHTFPMDRAPARSVLTAKGNAIAAEIIDWPMTAIRLKSPNRDALLSLANDILMAWRNHDDPQLNILSHTDEPHNTITPIVRRTGAQWTMSLVLRNNRTDRAHPLGIFHPHNDLHHIKRENIGLIEVMGLFILPGRLKTELEGIKRYLTGARDLSVVPETASPLHKHHEWAVGIAEKTGTALTDEAADAALRSALAAKCARVLQDAGVYKADAAGQAGLMRFMKKLGYQQKT